ncbi:Ribonuclease [Dirofilaria immitis]
MQQIIRSTSSALSSLTSSCVTLVPTVDEINSSLIRHNYKSLTIKSSERKSIKSSDLLFRPIVINDGNDDNDCYYYDVYSYNGNYYYDNIMIVIT